MRFIFIIFLLLTSAASASYAGDKLPEPKPDMALVYVIRTNAPPAPKETYFSVGHNIRVATLPNGSYSYFYIAPGFYQFWFKWPLLSAGRPKEFEEPVEAGKTYFFELRAMIGNGLDNFHRSVIWKYNETEGSERIKNCCKYVEAMVPSVDAMMRRKIVSNNYLLARPEEVVNITDTKGGYLRRLLAGNTAIGIHVKRGYQFKVYFNENGNLTEIIDSEKSMTGKWTIKGEDTLCFNYTDSFRGGCGTIEPNQDGSYSFSRNGNEKRRFERIAPGKNI